MLSAWSAPGAGCAVLALLALLTAAAADDAGKRAESEYMSPMPFVLGSRYGRSQPRLMSARNDRFFMGSRYGKRSEPWGGGGGAGAGRPLWCAALGGALYACRPAPRPAPGPGASGNYHYVRRSEESPDLGEKE